MSGLKTFLEGVKSAGVVRGVGANEIGEIENYPEVCYRRMNSERTHKRNGNVSLKNGR